MKKSFKTIMTIIIIGFMLVGAYQLGTMQAETITKVQTRTVTKVKEVEKLWKLCRMDT